MAFTDEPGDVEDVQEYASDAAAVVPDDVEMESPVYDDNIPEAETD